MGTHDPKDIDEEVNSSWKLVSHLVSILFKLRMLNTEIATECDRALLPDGENHIFKVIMGYCFF